MVLNRNDFDTIMSEKTINKAKFIMNFERIKAFLMFSYRLLFFKDSIVPYIIDARNNA